tara:strand:- start:178 stop:1140 length:963 start_codon:yes stop_codon:yes gene_type:complete
MQKNTLLKFYTLVFIFGIFSCVQKTKKCVIEVNRFEQDFFNIKEESFDEKFIILKEKYPEFFRDSVIDYKNSVFLNDTMNLIFDSLQVFFKQDILVIDEIESGYCNYKKYFPLDTFSIYTYMEGTFDYRYPVVYSNGKLFVSLDLFLGSEHSFYNGFPDYIKYSHDIKYLPSTCYVTLAGKHIPYYQDANIHNFISSIIHAAKPYFFAKKMLLNTPDHYLFKCEKEKINWCKNNEKLIWEYMIDNEYLFSSSANLIERFVDLAPFSKFGLDIDQNSPGSVGVWLGLQILNSYENNNNVSLLEILSETDYMKILNKSGYKP